MTLMGLVLWPLCLLFWGRPQRLLEFALIGGMFPAAAVLVAGGLGLQPSIAPAVFFLSFIGLQIVLGAHFPHARQALNLCAPLLAVGGLTLAGSIILPRVFENTVLVWPQKLDAVSAQVPLAPSHGNITQDCYVILDLTMFVLTTWFLLRREANLRRLFGAYVLSGAVVSVIGAWQMAHRLVGGIPFPDSFLYSNPAWAILNTQMSGPVPRINATFTEPAACATALSGVLYATVWSTLRGYGGWMTRVTLVMSAVCMLTTTSTTGYLTMAAGIILMILYAIISRSGPLLRRLIGFIVTATLFFGIATVAISAFAPSVISAAGRVMADTQDKKHSSSYEERSQKDADAIVDLYATYGLGTGWGSNRASSLMPTFLSTIGILGVAGLLLADWRIISSALRAIRQSGGVRSDEAWIIEASACAMLGRIIGTLFSGPVLGSIDFYILLALMIAATIRLHVANRARRAGATSG